MARIEIFTEIDSPPDVVFDLSRDLDFHQSSMVDTQEQAITGRTSGLIELGEEVTWRASILASFTRTRLALPILIALTTFVTKWSKGDSKFLNMTTTLKNIPSKSGDRHFVDPVWIAVCSNCHLKMPVAGALLSSVRPPGAPGYLLRGTRHCGARGRVVVVFTSYNGDA